MIRLVLFDIDGTLIVSGGAGQKAFARACEAVFHVPNGAQRLQFAGRTDTSIVRDFFMGHGIEPSATNFAAFFEGYLGLLKGCLQESEGWILPGIHGLIRDLRALPGAPLLGLLTGNVRRGAEIKLGHYQLWDQFETGAFGDDHEDRNGVAVVARERGRERLGAGLRGEEILVIGDTPLDVACARAIDAKCLAVATGTSTVEELRALGPTWAVESVEQISARTLCD